MRLPTFIKTLAAVTGTLAAGHGVCDDFSGKASFGYLGTSGNSDTTSVNAGTKLDWELGRWTHHLEATALGAQDSNETTAEAYALALKSDWALTDASYLFGRARWDKDKFSGYDQQITETVGYGRKLIDNEITEWSAEVGAGARQSDLRDGTSENESIIRAATDFSRQLTETSAFNASLSVESGSDNTVSEGLVAVKARLVGDLALVASYRVRQNSDVPAGSEKTDTFTAISLEYAF